MIFYSDDNIMSTLHTGSVILHQVNCHGTLTSGIAKQLSARVPKWYDDYRSYCSWFSGNSPWNTVDHTDEILGTFHRYSVPEEGFIICSAFGQAGIERGSHTDVEAWSKILRKIVNQTKYVNTKAKPKWTIHVQAAIGTIGKNGDNTELMDLFTSFFSESEVDLYIHLN